MRTSLADPPSRFVYDEAQLAALYRSLSPERLSPYVAKSDGNKLAAIRLYERNITLSESLYGVLQCLEIALRNAIDRTLNESVGMSWYDRIPLYHLHATIGQAKLKLTADEKSHDPGRMVAELTFGFWTSLMGPKFAAELWNPHLHRAFPFKRLQRKEAHRRLDRIRKLRNRVAHHEPILDRDLDRDYRDILDTIGWICPHTRLWIVETGTFQRRFIAG